MDYYEAANRFWLMEESDKRSKEMNEMERFFLERTKKHIGRVKDFIEIVSEFYPASAAKLRGRGMMHDQSKYYIPERKPYILLTWKYKMKKEGVDIEISDKDSERIREATFHHVKNNAHHPEYHDQTLKSNPINKGNREKRDKMADATAMDDLSITEMVCDWSAMSKENGEDSPRKWADESIKSRWKFSPKQQDFIYEIIDLLWS